MEVIITKPKFKQEFKYKLNKTIMPKMGIQQVFDAELAEVDEMCIYPMYVKEVIHNTFIDVSEEGTEAAAVTVVSGDLTTALPNYIVFNVDRPFIYAIAENSTGSMLFMGRINSF